MQTATKEDRTAIETMNELVANIVKHIEESIDKTDKLIDLEFLEEMIHEEIEKTRSLIGEEYLPGEKYLTYNDALQSMRLVIYKVFNKWRYTTEDRVDFTSSMNYKLNHSAFIECCRDIEVLKNSALSEALSNDNEWLDLKSELEKGLCLFMYDGLKCAGIKDIESVYEDRNLESQKHKRSTKVVEQYGDIESFLQDKKIRQFKDQHFKECSLEEKRAYKLEKLAEYLKSEKQLFDNLQSQNVEETDKTPNSNYKDEAQIIMEQLVPNIINELQEAIDNTKEEINTKNIYKAMLIQINKTSSLIGEQYLPGSKTIQYKDALKKMETLIHTCLCDAGFSNLSSDSTNQYHIKDFQKSNDDIIVYKNSNITCSLTNYEKWQRITYRLKETLTLFKFDALKAAEEKEDIDMLYIKKKLLSQKYGRVDQIVGPSEDIAKFLYKLKPKEIVYPIEQERPYDLNAQKESHKDSNKEHQKELKKDKKKKDKKDTDTHTGIDLGVHDDLRLFQLMIGSPRGLEILGPSLKDCSYILKKLITRTAEESNENSPHYKGIEYFINELKLTKRRKNFRIGLIVFIFIIIGIVLFYNNKSPIHSSMEN